MQVETFLGISVSFGTPSRRSSYCFQYMATCIEQNGRVTHGNSASGAPGSVEEKQSIKPLKLTSGKRLSVVNAEINAMSVDTLRQQLEELSLETRGVKDVLKRRLKTHYRKEALSQGVTAKPITPSYRYYCVMDVEATCEEDMREEYTPEIIELPVMILDSQTGVVVDTFHKYCRPVVNPKLTDYCVALTGIAQRTVDRAKPFSQVFDELSRWMNKHFDEEKSFIFLTDGDWDIGRFVACQCKLSDMPVPPMWRSWVNVRKHFSNTYKTKRLSIEGMLDVLNMTFEGRQHCGLDDTKNIVRITQRLLEDGCRLAVNAHLPS